MFNLDNYETVEERLARFWADHPGGRIFTSVHAYDEQRVLFSAAAFFDANDPQPRGTGHAEEVRGSSPVNKTSHVENAETSAIGRALANCGYAPKGARPSREEMQKVSRGEHPTAAPAPRPAAPRPPAPNNVTPISGGKVTEAQAKLIAKLGKERAVGDMAAFLSDALEKPVADIADLDKRDASAAIKALMDMGRG